METQPEPFKRDELFRLYEIAIEEYRFEVRLNWDRTAYHLTLNCSFIAVAAGLLKLDGSPTTNLYVAGIFCIGALVAFIGRKTVKKGHEYYRNTVSKKILIEDQLGLLKPLHGYGNRQTMTIGTTTGQQEHIEALHNSAARLRKPFRRASIVSQIATVFIIFCLADITGAIASFYKYAHATNMLQLWNMKENRLPAHRP